MGEGFSSTRSEYTHSLDIQAQLKQHQTALGLAFPVYILTNSFNSPHLPVLQKQLQTHQITLSVQSAGQRLQLIHNTYQKRCFIVLNAVERDNSKFLNAQGVDYQKVRYPESKLQEVMASYRQFVLQQLRKISNADLAALRVPIQITQQQQHKLPLSTHTTQSSIKKSVVKLRNVSKIVNNYKSVWPKQLFIYSNRHDDSTYQKYVSLIRNMAFDNACFISHIQDYVKCLPQKGDVCFCVLMSEYSVLNLRKFFKGADQMLLLCENTQQCLPLLRGKVTYFTTEIECLDKLLIERYGMREKKLQLQRATQDIDSIQKQRQQLYKQLSQQLVQKASSKEQICYESQKSASTLHFNIHQQYSLVNEPARSLELQSNIIAYNYTHHPMLTIIQQENQQIGSSKELQANCRKQQTSFNDRELVQKWTPLKIVQLQMPSLANISIKSSEVSQERQLFEQLIDKLNNETSIEHIQTPKKINVEDCHLMDGGDHQDLSGCKQNGNTLLKGSSSSRFSKASHNSRIIDRMKERQSKMSCKMKSTQ